MYEWQGCCTPSGQWRTAKEAERAQRSAPQARTPGCSGQVGGLVRSIGADLVALKCLVPVSGCGPHPMYVAPTAYPAAHALLPCTHPLAMAPAQPVQHIQRVAHALLPWAPKHLAPTLTPHPLVLTIPTQPVHQTTSCPAQPPLAPTPYPTAHTLLPCVPPLAPAQPVQHIQRVAHALLPWAPIYLAPTLDPAACTLSFWPPQSVPIPTSAANTLLPCTIPFGPP